MRRSAMVLLLLGALVACEDDDEGYDPTVATGMEIVDGSGQSGVVGAALPDPMRVVVTNLEGDPVSGFTVQWVVASGGGTLSAGSSVTDAAGIASVEYTLGPVVGAQRVQALGGSLPGSPVNFDFTARTDGGGGGGGGGDPARRAPAR